MFCYYFLLDTSEFLSLMMNQLFEMCHIYITLIRDLHQSDGQVAWRSTEVIPSLRGLGANAWKSVFKISPSHCSCLGSSVVEHQSWNWWVVGSIPARGVWFFQYLFCYHFLLDQSEFLSLTMNQLFEMCRMCIHNC